MLKELKNRLAITWSDSGINEKLQALTEESKEALNYLIGVELDYSKPENRELLFNRIRYAYNNALEFFEENFHSEITRIQLMEGVKKL